MTIPQGRAITPDEVVAVKAEVLPAAVLDCFNKAIALAWNGAEARVLQKDVLRDITSAMNCAKTHAFNEGWLDVEEVFRAAGWDVVYDKPGLGEDYEAFFRFRKA